MSLLFRLQSTTSRLEESVVKSIGKAHAGRMVVSVSSCEGIWTSRAFWREESSLAVFFHYIVAISSDIETLRTLRRCKTYINIQVACKMTSMVNSVDYFPSKDFLTSCLLCLRCMLLYEILQECTFCLLCLFTLLR